MAPDEPSGARPPPVVLRIKLRYDDAESMVQRFAANVGRQGIFLPTKSIQPIDSEVKFELRLANDAPVIVGLGRVRGVRAPDPANPRAAFGMAIELMRVTRESRDVILRMLDRRKQLGLPDIAMPMAEDVDSSRRAESEPAPRKDPEAVPEAAPLMTAPRRQSAPMAVAKESSIQPLAPEPVKRPRPRISELIAKSAGAVANASVDDDHADADVDVASALARARALATGDLDQELESLKQSASAPREITIEAASAELAKQLGGSAVRRDRSARLVPPPTVAEGTAQTLTVTTAAEGTAQTVTVAPSEPVVAPAPVAEIPPRGRTQPLPRIKPLAPLSSIAPLPAAPTFLVEPKPEPAPEPVAEWDAAVPTVASTEPPGAMVEATPAREPIRRLETPNPTYLRASTADIAEAIAAIDDVAEQVAVEAQPAVAAEEPSRPSSSSMDVAIDDAFNATMRPDTPIPEDPPDPDEFEAATAGPSVEVTPLPHEVVHQLSELDMEDVEHTNVGAAPDGYNPDELADQLERHLADAEAEAEAELRQAIDEASGGVHAAQASYGSAEARSNADALRSEIDEFEIEEVSDFEIIAEADADDADLLLADGERDASQDAAEPIADEPPLRPSQDFASRLDLGDDEFSAEHSPPAHGLPDNPVTPSSGYALSAYDDRLHEDPHSYDEEPLDFDRPSERYRYQPRSFDPLPEIGALTADRPPAEEFDEPHAGFGHPRYESEPAAAQEPSRDVELERTLSALDVDLDDLSLPHARPLTPSPSSGALRSRSPSGPVAPVQAPRTKQPTPARPIPEATPAAGSGRVHRRASTEDGILIDFEDDDD